MMSALFLAMRYGLIISTKKLFLTPKMLFLCRLVLYYNFFISIHVCMKISNHAYSKSLQTIVALLILKGYLADILKNDNLPIFHTIYFFNILETAVTNLP